MCSTRKTPETILPVLNSAYSTPSDTSSAPQERVLGITSISASPLASFGKHQAITHKTENQHMSPLAPRGRAKLKLEENKGQERVGYHEVTIMKGYTNEVWSSLLPENMTTSAGEVLVAMERLWASSPLVALLKNPRMFLATPPRSP